jgi:hypothetical protein
MQTTLITKRCRRLKRYHATMSKTTPKPYVSVLIRINYDGWRALKLLAVELDTSINSIGIDAFNDILVKHGKRPVVSRGKRPKAST